MPRATSAVPGSRASPSPPPRRADRRRVRRRPKRRGGRVSARVRKACSRSRCRRPDARRWRPVPAARPTRAEAGGSADAGRPVTEAQATERVGLQARTQRARGQPLASAPRWRCASPTASTTRGTPAASASAVTSTSRSLRSTRVRPEEPHQRRSEAAAAAASAERRSTAASREATRRARSPRRSSTPAPVLAETTRTATRPARPPRAGVRCRVATRRSPPERGGRPG